MPWLFGIILNSKERLKRLINSSVNCLSSVIKRTPYQRVRGGANAVADGVAAAQDWVYLQQTLRGSASIIIDSSALVPSGIRQRDVLDVQRASPGDFYRRNSRLQRAAVLLPLNYRLRFALGAARNLHGGSHFAVQVLRGLVDQFRGAGIFFQHPQVRADLRKAVGIASLADVPR